jgi:hypothetical protein
MLSNSTIQQFFALSALIRLYLRPIKPLLLFATTSLPWSFVDNQVVELSAVASASSASQSI